MNCVFRDSTGKEYISSPALNVGNELLLLLGLGAMLPTLITVGLWLGGWV